MNDDENDSPEGNSSVGLSGKEHFRLKSDEEANDETELGADMVLAVDCDDICIEVVDSGKESSKSHTRGWEAEFGERSGGSSI